MRYFLLMIAVVMGQSVLAADEKPLITNPIVEKEIRRWAEKPTGELTEADLEKVTRLYLRDPKITDADLKEVAKLQNLKHLILDDTKITDAGLKEVAKLKQLKSLYLTDTQVIKAGVAELQKALPKCYINSNPAK